MFKYIYTDMHGLIYSFMHVDTFWQNKSNVARFMHERKYKGKM